MRLYHLVAINEKTGKKVYLTEEPVTHHDACVIKSKFCYHPARRVQLEEA